jgi:uncharacterized protein
MAERVFFTGGTGFIGSALVAALRERGDAAVVLTRDPGKARRRLPAGVELVEGDPTEAGAWQQSLAGCSAVINLAGASLGARRWNAHYKQILRDSRVDSTRFVVEGIGALDPADRPGVLLSASGTDYYPFADDLDAVGRDEDEPVTEEIAPGDSSLARLCRAWESEARAAELHDVRVVLMRTAVVLGEAGALDKLSLPFKFFAGGRVGSGTQWFSWIHLRDVVRAYLFALDTPGLGGAVNLVAPGNVRNAELARALGAAMHRPSWIPVPGFAVRAAVGEFADYVLHGRRAVPARLEQAGFRFDFPEIDAALADIYR